MMLPSRRQSTRNSHRTAAGRCWSTVLLPRKRTVGCTSQAIMKWI